MPWARFGDTSASYPRLLAVEALPDAPPGARPLMMGFISMLAVNSAAWKTDYIVHAGHIMQAGGTMHDWLLTAALKTGLLSRHNAKVFGVQAYKIIAEKEFIHIRLKAETDWEDQQRNDTNDLRISLPVRVRDGDHCRYCAVLVHWMGRKSPRKATLDHLVPKDADGNRPGATVDTMVVACLSCNSEFKDAAGEERAALRPRPDTPFYGETTADWLTKNGTPTTPTADSQRPATPADNAATATSDPAPSGQRVATPARPQRPAHPADNAHRQRPATPADNAAESSRVNLTDQVEDRDSAGTGRVGTGRAGSSIPTRPGLDRPGRRRSRRRRPPPAQRNGEA